jgi:hypothetical protein
MQSGCARDPRLEARIAFPIRWHDRSASSRAVVKASANQPKAANQEIMRRTGHVVPASREISACSPRSIAAVA